MKTAICKSCCKQDCECDLNAEQKLYDQQMENSMSKPDKSYWKEFSGIELDKATYGKEYALYINSGNERWALFVDGEWVIEDSERVHFQTGEIIRNPDGLVESLIGSQVPPKVVRELVSFYIEFLFEESES